jgi:hypothetical protein
MRTFLFGNSAFMFFACLSSVDPSRAACVCIIRMHAHQLTLSLSVCFHWLILGPSREYYSPRKGPRVIAYTVFRTIHRISKLIFFSLNVSAGKGEIKINRRYYPVLHLRAPDMISPPIKFSSSTWHDIIMYIVMLPRSTGCDDMDYAPLTGPLDVTPLSKYWWVTSWFITHQALPSNRDIPSIKCASVLQACERNKDNFVV